MLVSQLLLVMACGTVQIYVFSTLGPFITEDLHLSLTSFGMLTTVYFVVGAALSPASGSWADRLGGVMAARVVLLVSIVALAGTAAAGAYVHLLLFSALGGVAGAIVNPATNRLVADLIPRPRQGIVMGIKQSGVQMGAFGAGIMLPWLSERIGWQRATLALAAVPLIAVLMPIPHERTAGRRTATGPVPPVHPGVWVLALYSLLMGSVVATTGTYLPLFAHDVLSYSPPKAGLAGAAVGLMGILSRIVWGRMASREGHIGVILMVMGLIGSGAVLMLLAAPIDGAFMIGAIIGLGVSAAGWNAVAMLAALRLGGAHGAGKSSGVVVLGFYLGYALSPALFGWVVDSTGSYGPAWAGVGMVSLCGAAVGAVITRKRWFTHVPNESLSRSA